MSRWRTEKEPIVSDDTFLKSSFYEQLVEHVFISEVLQEAWYRFGNTVEVLRSEVDASGYDVVFECNGFLRHVQLKTSKEGASAKSQKVNIALASKPGGCVVWLIRREDAEDYRMRLSYLYFGGAPGEPLPSIAEFKPAKHTKADAQRVKKIRPAIRVVRKSSFTPFSTTRELVQRLFGLETQIPDRIESDSAWAHCG